MMVKLEEVVMKISGNEDRFTTDLEYYLAGEHYESERIAIYKKGIIKDNLGVLGFKFHFPFKAGDTIFMSRNPHLKKAGMVTYDGICSDTSYILRTRDNNILNERFLPLVLQNDRFWRWFEENKSGSVNYLLNWKSLKEYEFDLPPIEEQLRIADIAWAVEETRVAYERMIAATDDLVKSQFMEQFGDPVSNTQGREVRPFKDFMLDIRYGTSQPPVFSEDGVFKFIRATNIKAGRITEKDMLRISAEEASKIEKCRLNGNEIIIVRSGANTGDTCIVTEEYRDQYAGYDIIITLNLKIANPVFFNELMNTHYMQAVIKPLTARAAQPHINSEQVQNLPMLVVPLSEQEQFAAFVRQSDKSKFELEQALAELNATYKRIITENLC